MDFLLQVFGIVFWFIIILLPLVAIHEFGHLLMARLVGVKVNEYGIGLPPRWKFFRWKGIIWSLNYTLLGGFARIYGDHDALDEAKEKSKSDPKAAKLEYIDNRLAELVSNQEVQFFLEENNLEYTAQWKWFETVAKKGLDTNKLSDEKLQEMFASLSSDETKSKDVKIDEIKETINKKYLSLTSQLQTLVEWEFDSKLDTKEAFFNKNWFQQTLIILGGVTFNLISAVIFFWLMFSFTGTITQYAFTQDSNAVSGLADISYKSEYVKAPQVYKDTAADKAGLKPGDDLIAVAGKNINELNSIQEFRDLMTANSGQEVIVQYRSKETGERKESKVLLESKNGSTQFGVAGLGFEVKYKAKNPVAGLQLATTQTADLFILNYKVIGQIVVALLPQTEDKAALEYVSGPIAVSSFSQRIFRDYGAPGILQLLALISIGLAAFNLLPLPALDGGRLVILTLNKIFGKRNKNLEAIAISITFFLLLALGVLIAFRDVQGIIDGKF